MDEGNTPPPDHALDEATIELGRREINRIRAQLRGTQPDVTEPGPPDAPDGDRERGATAGERTPDADRHEIAADRFSTERITAEMTAAAAREHLEARVDQLEIEVRQLRAALAAVMRAAASGLDTQPRPEDHPPPPPPATRPPAGAEDLRADSDVD